MAAILKSLAELKEITPEPVNQVLDQVLLGSQPIRLQAQSADPADPPASEAVLWLSDGTGTGSDGDLIIKWADSAGSVTTETITKA